MKEANNNSDISNNNNNSNFSTWKNSEEKDDTGFCNLLKAEGEFGDLKRYSEFLGLNTIEPSVTRHLELVRTVFQSEVHRLFPAEKEDLPREFLFKFDLSVMVFEDQSTQYMTFVKGVFEAGYYPVCLDIKDMILASNYFIFVGDKI